MKFSVIVPCYKVEKYLSECVDSVLNQTYTDFEVILVDDGSPDRVPEICDEYVKKDFSVRVVHQKNAGIACARNAGIAVANGEYVICIDSDDYLIDANVLSHINEKTATNPDVVMFGYKKYFESDGSWGTDVVAKTGDNKDIYMIIKTMLQNGSYMATAWTKAVKRQILVEYNITFRPGMVSGEDVDWFLNLLCHIDSFIAIERACLAYRQRSDSISHSPKIQSLTDFIWILKTWPEKTKKLNISDSLRSVIMNTMAYYWANTMVLYAMYDKKFVCEYKQNLKEMCYLSAYAVTSRAVIVKRFCKWIGFDMTIFFLKTLNRLKKRQ